ncbi:hypothetical protein MASR2M15_08180 [Anaerolineales bacterium]
MATSYTNPKLDRYCPQCKNDEDFTYIGRFVNVITPHQPPVLIRYWYCEKCHTALSDRDFIYPSKDAGNSLVI